MLMTPNQSHVIFLRRKKVALIIDGMVGIKAQFHVCYILTNSDCLPHVLINNCGYTFWTGPTEFAF